MMLKILFGTAALLLLLYNVYVQKRKFIVLKREYDEILEAAKDAADGLEKATNIIEKQRLRLEKYKMVCFEYGCHTLIS